MTITFKYIISLSHACRNTASIKIWFSETKLVFVIDLHDIKNV